MTGYGHEKYAESLSEFGTPHYLPKANGWILIRDIPGTPYRDAMGGYPLFVCEHWDRLSEDLDNLGDESVAVSIVTDPFGDSDGDELRRAFPDRVIEFKKHYVVELSVPEDKRTSRHHRYYARRGLESVDVERLRCPQEALSDWVTLYAELVARHGIRGIALFSERSFAKQLTTPGITVFCARQGGEVVGMNLWYADNDRAYLHLAAYDTRGYAAYASYALMQYAIEYFRDRCLRELTLGAGVGHEDRQDSGLARFKRGWSSTTRQVYFCGRIMNRRRYDELAASRGEADSDFFPAYRKGDSN